MDTTALIDRLARFPDALGATLAGLRDTDWQWRPDDTRWSLADVVAHLAVEETDDFRPRLQAILADPTRDWPPLEPEEAVVSMRGDGVAPAERLARFRRERAASVVWLRSLAAVDWDVVKTHPKFPPLRAGELLASWAAHDARHLEQIAKRLHGLAARDGAPYPVGYAG